MQGLGQEVASQALFGGFTEYSGKSKVASAYFGNVAVLGGANAETFMKKRETHFWGAAETHLDEARLCQVRNRVKAAGWKNTATKVRRSEDSENGIKGGVMAAAKRGLDVKQLHQVKGMPREVCESEDMVGYVWTTRQMRLLI